MPTNTRFEGFLGNLHHLNAEEEPENDDDPDDPEFAKRFRPRGVIKSSADRRIEDTGPLTKKRQRITDDETDAAEIDSIRRSHKSHNPWFRSSSGTRMRCRTHVNKAMRNNANTMYGYRGESQASRVERDMHIGKSLELLDKLRLADSTIVHYSTDHGSHYNAWPDAAATPF